MSHIKDFQTLYRFTTENITGYIADMDIKDKKVLTVGSSCDQAFNSLLLGASEVTIFDINERVKEFYELKKKLIFEVSRENLIEKVNDIKRFSFFGDIFTQKELEKMNLYLANDENYQKLKQILEKQTINFVTGNIFDIGNSLNAEKQYDRVILSNVLQYLPKSSLPVEQAIYKIYNDLSHHLNDNAIVQLYYLYGSIYPKYFYKIVNEFTKNGILFQLSACDEHDTVVFAKKRTTIIK